MKRHLFLSLLLMLPLATVSACSDDDDSTNNTAGAGGTSGRAGASGNGGRSANAGTAGKFNAAGATGEAGSAGAAGNGSGTDTGGVGGEGGDQAAESGAGGAAASLNDAQILKVLSTANEGEVSVALVAKPSLQNSAAVSFAQMMISDHSTADGQTLALVTSKQLAPERSDVSDALEVDTATVISKLSKTPAAAFDKVYMDSQVTMHQEVLSLIDTRLLPDASDADLKALLTTLRTSVAAHLTNAQTISASLP